MKYLLCTIVVAMLASSCGKVNDDGPRGAGVRHNCKAFDPEVLTAWMPYFLNSTYEYIDSNGKLLKFTIDSTYYSEEYLADPLQDCVIKGSAYATADINDTTDMHVSFGYNKHARDPLGPIVGINWMDASVGFKNYSAEADTLQVIFVPQNALAIKRSLTFGSKNYSNIHEFTVNTNKLQKLYLAKGHGIVAFITANSTLYWKR